MTASNLLSSGIILLTVIAAGVGSFCTGSVEGRIVHNARWGAAPVSRACVRLLAS